METVAKDNKAFFINLKDDYILLLLPTPYNSSFVYHRVHINPNGNFSSSKRSNQYIKIPFTRKKDSYDIGLEIKKENLKLKKQNTDFIEVVINELYIVKANNNIVKKLLFKQAYSRNTYPYPKDKEFKKYENIIKALNTLKQRIKEETETVILV